MFANRELAPDPLSTFGHLLRGCISDAYSARDRALLEDAVFMVMGAAASLMTTYVLASFGVFV